MRLNRALGIGIYFVLACFEIGNARADCLVAASDDISKAFARGSQKIIDEDFSLLNREAITMIIFGSGIIEDDPAKPSVTANPTRPGLNVARVESLSIAEFAPPSALGFTPPVIIVVAPTFPMQSIDFDSSYTIAIKARPSC